MSNRKKCGACRYTGKDCRIGCVFRPHYPDPEDAGDFGIMHKIFHRENLLKMIGGADLNDVEEVKRCLLEEAKVRTLDPIGGSTQKIEALKAEIAALRQEQRVVNEGTADTESQIETLIREKGTNETRIKDLLGEITRLKTSNQNELKRLREESQLKSAQQESELKKLKSQTEDLRKANLTLHNLIERKDRQIETLKKTGNVTRIPTPEPTVSEDLRNASNKKSKNADTNTRNQV